MVKLTPELYEWIDSSLYEWIDSMTNVGTSAHDASDFIVRLAEEARNLITPFKKLDPMKDLLIIDPKKEAPITDEEWEKIIEKLKEKA